MKKVDVHYSVFHLIKKKEAKTTKQNKTKPDEAKTNDRQKAFGEVKQTIQITNMSGYENVAKNLEIHQQHTKLLNEIDQRRQRQNVIQNLEVHQHHTELMNELDRCRQRKNIEECLQEHLHHSQLLEELEMFAEAKQRE